MGTMGLLSQQPLTHFHVLLEVRFVDLVLFFNCFFFSHIYAIVATKLQLVLIPNVEYEVDDAEVEDLLVSQTNKKTSR